MENQTHYLGLWKQIIDRPSCVQAGVGLFCDAFAWASRIDHTLRDPNIDETPSTQEEADQIWSDLREELMEMVGDSDGKKLRHWLVLFQNHRTVFLELAEHCVEHCNRSS